MDRCLQEPHVLEWKTKGRTTFIQKHHCKRSNPKQIQTHYEHTYDVVNTNGTNKGRDLFLLISKQYFPEEQKGCCKGSRGTVELL